MEPKYIVDGTSHERGKDNGKEYAVWRVLVAETKQLVCAFYGGASHYAASSFCEQINSDPKWNAD